MALRSIEGRKLEACYYNRETESSEVLVVASIFACGAMALRSIEGRKLEACYYNRETESWKYL